MSVLAGQSGHEGVGYLETPAERKDVPEFPGAERRGGGGRAPQVRAALGTPSPDVVARDGQRKALGCGHGIKKRRALGGLEHV